MCKSSISTIKFIRLLAEVLFYNIIIFLIFVISGYESFSVAQVVKCVFPFYDISYGFISCYLLFYLLIPFKYFDQEFKPKAVYWFIGIGFVYLYFDSDYAKNVSYIQLCDMVLHYLFNWSIY